jgi:peptidoglycan hydrolase-like protein with peptidoglycan-binding domain
LSYSIPACRRRLAVAAISAIALLCLPAVAAAYQFGSRLLAKGMTGSDVRTLQKDLTISGFKTVVSGVFSQGTKFHVIDFQERYGLSADGVVGPITAGKLKTVVAAIERKASHKAAPMDGAGAGLGGSATNTASTTSASNVQDNPTTDAPLTASDDGGASVVPPPSDAPVEKATINSQGLAVPPADAPQAIVDVIDAANQIAFDPYVYGGGHDPDFQGAGSPPGYDCSGSVSFALHGGGMLKAPLDSTEFESWGDPGKGRWITLYTNAGHVYANIAGLWFDTVAQQETGDRWSKTRVSSPDGFTVVHPAGW